MSPEMGVRVRIPAPLRRLTGGQGLVEVAANTLAKCIESLEARFPGMREHLREDNGELRRFINIYVNGEDIHFLQELETPLEGGDEVTIVPAIAGG